MDRVAPVLARAFQDDPLFAWIEPDPAVRARFLVRFMRALAWRSHLFAEAWTTAPRPSGRRCGQAPTSGRLSPSSSGGRAWIGPTRTCPPRPGRRYEAFDAVRDVVERVVPRPRWYLGVLAVDPAAQGQRLGERLLAPGLARADAAALPTSLETTKEANVAWYERHGFAVAASGQVGGDGVRYWVMRREPRPR